MGGIQSIDALHGDPRSIPLKILSMLPPLTGFEVNLKFLQTRIFGSHTAITTVWEAFSFGEAIRDPEQTTHNTPEAARSSSTKGVRRIKEALFTFTGLSRIEQSTEVFVHCVLGAQENVRSRILGDGGRAKEARTEFLTLIEDAIRKPDLSESKSSGTWLMLSNMVINNSSAVGYNNQPIQVTLVRKFGVNNDVNKDTKKSGIRYMDGGKSEIK